MEIFYSNFITMLLFFKCGSSVDCVISVLVKTVFVLLLFDIGKVCRTKVFTKYFFASFSNDKELSLVDKTEVYVDRNTEGQVNSLHEVTT